MRINLAQPAGLGVAFVVVHLSTAHAQVCPPIGADSDCGTIITITDTGAKVKSTGQPPYDNVEDTLVGVVNNSKLPIHKLGLKSAHTIFAFDGDGIVSYGAPGNSKDSTGYGGPNAYFTKISGDRTTGEVNFITPIAPGGTAYFSLEEAISSAISCQDAVNNALSGPNVVAKTQINASFTPKLSLTLSDAAAFCGFIDFDWQQWITNLPLPSPFFQRGSKVPLSAPPPFLDPPPGGYSYQPSVDNSYPFYYDYKSGELKSQQTSTTLSFSDAPADRCLPGGSGAPCGGKTAPAGSFIGFITHLAGVNKDGSAQDLGIGFKWKTTFNGTSGGIDTTKNANPTDPNSGTGEVTILGVQSTTTYEYNGLAVTTVDDVPVNILPPTIDSLAVSPAQLWPPNNQLVDVTVSASAHDSTGTASCSITSVSSNETGGKSPQWIVDGPLKLRLLASREGSGNGRTYTIVVTCTGASSKLSATDQVTVLVPHDKSP